MRGVNKVILIGNATRDAELRHTQNGKSVSNIRLATNRSVKGEEETQFHTIVCWDRLAETTEEGKERGICEIIADDVQFLGRRGNGQRGESEA
jgi:single-strand DNA-binding protein